jgi:anthranilate synthase component 1
MNITLTQQGEWLQADTQTPISLYLNLVGAKKGILLESSEVDGRLGRYSLIAWDFKMTLASENGKLAIHVADDRLKDLLAHEGQDYLTGVRAILRELTIVGPEEIPGLPPMTRSLCGFFAYNTGGMFEPALADVLPPEKAETTLVLPGQLILFDHLHHRCCHLSLDDSRIRFRPKPGGTRTPTFGTVTAVPEKEDFMEGVRQAKELITRGEAIQIVLSTQFSTPFSGDPFELYRRLRQINPSPYTFYMNLPDITLLGSSPELMVKCTDGTVELRPIAGTRIRGNTPAEDRELAEDLLADPKERAEHVMLVDLGRNDLGRVARPGTVTLDQYMQVEMFSHVMHLTSYISAKVRPELDAVDVLKAAFPAGTVSGAPKIRAMQIIAEKETVDRGPYAGCIGWLGLDSDQVQMDTGITIRSMWIKDSTLYWQSGAGIVFDSDPEKEWQECHNKSRATVQAISRQGGTDDFVHRQL